MYTSILLLVIILLISVYYQPIQENFGLFAKDKTYYITQPTAHLPLNYKGCIGFSNNEHYMRLADCPFYLKVFQTRNLQEDFELDNTEYIDKPLSLIEINQLVEKEVSSFSTDDIGPIAVLISTLLLFKRQRIILLFPKFDKDKKNVTVYSMISKFNRWYYTLLYNDYYKASSACVNGVYSQCPGILPYRRRTGNFIIGFKTYIYTTPCGTLFAKEANPMLPYYFRDIFYATYIPKKYNKKPNLSILSQYDGMRYGCDTHLISENGQYMLMLDNLARGLVLYKVLSGDPYSNCRFTPKKIVWRFPLKSILYARFKLEDSVIRLIDYNKEVWRVTVNTPNIPIVLKLSNDGTLELYDSKNNLLEPIDMNAVFSKEKIDNDKNDEIEAEIEAELLRQLNLRKQQQALQKKQEEADDEYYNKQVCPIGSTT